jgi:dTDP-4-dehydrorhamnose reductase
VRIVVTGRNGQVVRSLVARTAPTPEYEIIPVGRPELDLLGTGELSHIFAARHPDLIVSAAAYTAVERAEDEPEVAYAVNAAGAERVAQAAAAIGVPIIHLSTDYVFSGVSGRPYSENDAPAPCCVYGRSKLAGELAVAAANPNHVILRTAWVYSPFGSNFVKTMLRKALESDTVPVVADQFGSPTSAFDVADGILAVASRLADVSPSSRYGTFHLAGTGSTNWAAFATYVFEVSRDAGGPFATVRAISTAEHPTKVPRPANSILNTDKFNNAFGWRAPHWRESTRIIVLGLLEQNRITYL